jgi:hypothetical protein
LDNLKIDGTKKTPLINFDAATGIFQIKGRSVPEDTYEFYDPILHWVDEYSKSPNSLIVLKIELDYFNTSSSKFLLEFLKKTKNIKINSCNCDLKIEWYYEDGDDEMRESGQDFMDLLGIPFGLICISNE